MTRLLSVLAAFSLGLAGCSAHSVMVHRPQQPALDKAITRMWADEVRANAQDGDWIMTRSYYLVGDVISAFTSGEDLSHASIYSARTGTVIEAVTPVVREIPLEQLIERNHYVFVVRPSKMTAAERSRAVLRARSQLGKDFDARGMFGFDNPDAWYCSELIYWASGVSARHHDHQVVVTPSEMMEFGEIVYWSGERTDTKVLAAAREEIARPTGIAAVH